MCIYKFYIWIVSEFSIMIIYCMAKSCGLFKCAAHIVHSCHIVEPKSSVAILSNIVDNIGQCGQNNIVQASCFDQP